VIPLPILESVHIEKDGQVLVWIMHGRHEPCVRYRMIDNDPTRLEPAE
jgi:hypothetical protein